MIDDIINKLDEVINAIPKEFKDSHPCSPYWYVSELCRYIKKEIEKGEDYRKYSIILDMPLGKVKEMLHYKGLSFFD